MTTIIGSYNICNRSDILSKILPIVLRLIAVSVYTVAIGVWEYRGRKQRRMHAIHAEVPFYCCVKICLLIFAHTELS